MRRTGEEAGPEDRPALEDRPKRLNYNMRRNRGRLHITIPETDRGKFHYYWAVDRAERIAQLKEEGYSRVDLEVDGGTVRHAGSAKDGSDQKHVLMRIPIAWYEEDQMPAREHRESLMNPIMKNPLHGDASSQEDLNRIDETHGYLDVTNSGFNTASERVES